MVGAYSRKYGTPRQTNDTILPAQDCAAHNCKNMVMLTKWNAVARILRETCWFILEIYFNTIFPSHRKFKVAINKGYIYKVFGLKQLNHSDVARASQSA